MSDNIENTPEARWKHLRDNGTKVKADLSTPDLIVEKPSWFDEAQFARAKAAVDQYYVGVLYSSLTGLLLILQLPDGLEPLLSTGNSKDIPSLYKRYLSTILHVNSWYEDDIFNPETKGYKSIRQVRAMHKRVQELMNERHRVSDVNGKERVWMTQYDVAVTQFAFIGLAMLYPEKSALIAASHEDIELINYYWRVLGYLMGMKDEFNSCQFERYEDIKEFNRLIFEHEFKAVYKKEPCPLGLEMSKAICTALQYYMPLITFNSLAHWWSDCFSFNGYELQPKSAKDRLLLLWQDLSFYKLLKYQGFLRFSNKLHKRRFERRLKKRDEVYKQLKDRYQNGTQTSFYSDRVDYFNKNPTQVGSDDANNNNNNNNGEENNNNNNAQVRVKQQVSALATTTFKGCPMGYDADLPAVFVEPVATA